MILVHIKNPLDLPGGAGLASDGHSSSSGFLYFKLQATFFCNGARKVASCESIEISHKFFAPLFSEVVQFLDIIAPIGFRGAFANKHREHVCAD